MNEENEASFQESAETEPEHIDKETLAKNADENNSDIFEKKPENFSEVQEDISFEEIFGNTNGVDNKFLIPEVLEDVSTSEPKNESNSLQSEKNAVSFKEQALNQLVEENIEVVDKENPDQCINTKEETIKDINIENNFSMLDNLQNRENKKSTLVKENIDSVSGKNVKKTLQGEDPECYVEEATIIMCEEMAILKEEKTLYEDDKSVIYNASLTKNQDKDKFLSENEKSKTESVTNENKKIPVSKEETTIHCEEKSTDKNLSINQDEKFTKCNTKELTTPDFKEKLLENKSVSSNQNEKILAIQTKESTAQGEDMLVYIKKTSTTYCEDSVKSKNNLSNQNEKIIPQIKQSITDQNENSRTHIEEKSVNQREKIVIYDKNLTKNQNEESKTAEVLIQDSRMTDYENSRNILSREEKVFSNLNESVVQDDKTSNCTEEKEKNVEPIKIKNTTVNNSNVERNECEKNETCNNLLDLNKNDKSENLEQSKNKKLFNENQKRVSEEIITENKNKQSKEEIHENFTNLGFVDVEKNEDKRMEQLHSELESKSLTEVISSSNLVQTDTQEKVQANHPPDDITENLKFSEVETCNLQVQNQEKNDCLQELMNSENNVNNSNIGNEHDEEENHSNKSENESTEVMDTEMINCNEFENVDLNENEMQKEKEIDRIGIESSDADLKNEEMVVNSCENDAKFNLIEEVNKSKKSNTSQNEPMLIDDQFDHPGDCENETIIGDACTHPSINVNDEEQDICIIPDDGTPKVSILSQNKSKKKEEPNESIESTKASAKKNKASTAEAEKVKLRSEEKNSENIPTKTRPLRNAAKLAGNKIKSLVLNDMVLDENSLTNNVKGEGEINANQEMRRECAQCKEVCKEVKLWKSLMVQGNRNKYLCSEQCSEAFAKANQIGENFSEIEINTGEFSRKCAQCHSQITINDKSLFWETMDFCNEDCLGKYQAELGSNCANCKGNVASISLGKYCVRFGSDVKQFCSATCLEEYKKGLKVCSYCQKDISTGTEGFLAPVGDKGQFKDFCTQFCMEKYERMCGGTPQSDVVEECAVCSNSKPVRVEVELDSKTHKLCSEPCFAAFKFVNNITEGQCDMCRKYFDRVKTGNFSVFYDENLRSFCCKTCMNVYILANRKIVPCNWCKVKKYNFDMIKKVSATGQLLMMCSLNCLMLYQASVNAVCSRRVKCDFCMSLAQAQYHLTMSDASIRNFCSYTCVMSFQVMKKKLDFGTGEDRSNIILEFFAMRCKNNRYPKQAIDLISGAEQINSPIPTGGPKRVSSLRPQIDSSCVPVISSVQSLAPPNASGIPSGRVPIPITDVNMMTQVTPLQQPLTIPTTVEIASTTVTPMPAPPPPQIYQQIITKPPQAKIMKNKSILCKPYSHTKGVSCRPHPCLKDTQTDQSFNRKCLIPIPVPIYVPTPMHMFATPFPVPVPFPLPVPVPIFIPTTRNSAKGIFKEIKKIQEKIPTDPFEAELLMMAEMVAGEKKQDPTDSESEDGNEGDDNGDETFSPENVDTSNTFGDDMLQMALKMASELEEPAVDMESVLTSNTITTSSQPPVDPNKALYDQVNVMSINRGRKRSVRGSRSSTGGTPSKRGRRTSGSVDVPLLPPPEPVPPPRIEVEKPDANMCLKYTFGVNAWRHWVMQKNAELEKAAMTNRKIKLFKPELLQLTADELNFSLCLFVKEVRKPNGTEYAPDTIYYLCLGIQQYLFENGRIDNIFTDTYYEKFTDCLDEVAKKFATLYNDSQYIVTRVEEEHLWESKQLGAHSPHVLLSTLMFFNTKHFNLVTVEEHMQLSFSHIMKHWKRNPNTPGVAKVPGSRNVLLRFYPPQSALEANSRKKKVYEQQENEENPLRCPVKLYEFYLSKCPESVKTRNDVFYLLPERSCVPDSPVWYSTMALGKEPLMKMLHRVKMVKEINIALLTC